MFGKNFLKEFRIFLAYVLIDQFSFPKTMDYVRKLIWINEVNNHAHQTRNWLVLVPFYSIHIVLLWNALHLIYMAFGTSSNILILFHFDVLSMFSINRLVYLLIVIVILNVSYFYQTQYISMDCILLKFINTILVDDGNYLFGWNYHYKNQLATKFLKRKMEGALKLLDLFIFGIGMLWVYNFFAVCWEQKNLSFEKHKIFLVVYDSASQTFFGCGRH